MARLIKADTKALDELGRDIDKAKRMMLGRVTERGDRLLKEEVPYKTGNLRQGVGPPDVDYAAMRSEIAVTARSAATGSRVAQVFNEKGERVKTVTLRPSKAYNYAETVARGNKQATLRPTHAKAFLIPVPSRPGKGGYLMVGGQIYIVRPTRKGQKPNPFDERAARRLEGEMARIGEGVLRDFVK